MEKQGGKNYERAVPCGLQKRAGRELSNVIQRIPAGSTNKQTSTAGDRRETMKRNNVDSG